MSIVSLPSFKFASHTDAVCCDGGGFTKQLQTSLKALSGKKSQLSEKTTHHKRTLGALGEGADELKCIKFILQLRIQFDEVALLKLVFN